MLRQKPTRKVPRKPTARRPEIDDLEKEQARLKKKEQELEEQIKVFPKKAGAAKKGVPSKRIVELNVAATADEFGGFGGMGAERAPSKRGKTELRRQRRKESNQGLIQFLVLTVILLFFLYLLFRVIPS